MSILTIGVKDIKFNSRIEAQWAYIFDKLGFIWEYDNINSFFIVKFHEKEIQILVKGEINIWKENTYKKYLDKINTLDCEREFAILGSNYISVHPGELIGIIFSHYEYKCLCDLMVDLGLCDLIVDRYIMGGG